MAAVSDEAFARAINQMGAATLDQIEAAQREQALRAQSGKTAALGDVLVEQGIIPSALRENVEKKLLAQQQGGLKSLGNYKLLKKLGEGGMGAVYLADDTVMGRKVALKVLPKKFASDPEFLQRFRREAKSAGKLNHVNIISAFTVGEELGNHFYVMEFCEGEPLDKLLKREGVLSWDRAIEITIMIARGLQHAHEHGLIHRDIKPANIFMASNPTSTLGKGAEHGIAKILDMGLSKDIGGGEQSFNTQTGVALGTPHYISPEQAKGEKTIDGRTDIYSLGATLYHLVTGQTPFTGSTAAMIIMKHLSEQLPNPQDIRDDIPDGVVQVIQKMMAKDAADRYADCAELLTDLEQVIDGKMPSSHAIDVGKSSIAIAKAPRRRGASQPAAARHAGTNRHEPVAARRASAQDIPAAKKNNSAIMTAAGACVLGLGILIYALSGKQKPAEVVKQNDPPPTTPDNPKNTSPNPLVQVSTENLRPALRPKLVGSYYEGTELEKGRRLLQRLDGDVNFAWEIGSPAPEIPSDKFSIRWDGFVNVEKPGKYTLQTFSDDGARLYIDRKLVIDAWKIGDVSRQSVEMDLTTGPHAIVLEYFEDKGAAYCHLSWSLKDGFPEQIIPTYNLFHTAEQEGGAANEIVWLDGAYPAGALTDNTAVGAFICQWLNPPEAAPGGKLVHSNDTHKNNLSQHYFYGPPMHAIRKGDKLFADIYLDPKAPPKAVMICFQSNRAETNLKVGWDHRAYWGENIINWGTDNTVGRRRAGPLPKIGQWTRLEVRAEDVGLNDGDPVTGLGFVQHSGERVYWGRAGVVSSAKAPPQIAGVDDAWITMVQKLPAEKQIDEVVKKLKELNPKYDGKLVSQKIENNDVITLEFNSPEIVNVSPLAAMSNLRYLLLYHAQATDLNPLRDLKLFGLWLDHSKVADLSPLADSKTLEYLSIAATAIRDLAPLKPLKLKTLNCSFTNVSSLETIRGMQLQNLNVLKTPVGNLSPIAEMPLKSISLTYDAARDQAILKSIKTLEQINDLPTAEFWKKYPEVAAVAGVDDAWVAMVQKLPAEKQVEEVMKKLKELNPQFDGKEGHKVDNGAVYLLGISAENITNIAPLRALSQLRTLYMGGNDWHPSPFKDLSGLKVLRLNTLDIHGTSVSDLTPLSGMPLTNLSCTHTRVQDLNPLRTLPLKELNLEWTLVADLAPLSGAPLTNLVCKNTRVTDLTPLRDVPLKELWADLKMERDAGALKAIKSLAKINGQSVPEFWAKNPAVAAGVDDAWVKSVQAMPGNEQFKTVLDKLKELNSKYNGKQNASWDNGKVDGLNLSDTAVSDISPLRAMSLTGLKLANTQVSDISPLKGMPIRHLELNGTQVKDLTPLREMLSLGRLFLEGAPVEDLSPLADTKLYLLTFTPSPGVKGVDSLRKIKTLSQINGMPAAEFWKKTPEAAAPEKIDDPARWKNALDLLPLVDPTRDTVLGDWTIKDGELSCLPKLFARIEIPFAPPEEYDVRLEFTRKDVGHVLNQILQQSGKPFIFSMSPFHKCTLFELIDGKDAVHENPSIVRPEGLYNANRRYVSIVSVRKDGLKSYVDGKLITEWKTDGHDLSLNQAWALRGNAKMGLGSSFGGVTYHSYKLRPIAGVGSFVRPEDPAAIEAKKKQDEETARQRNQK